MRAAPEKWALPPPEAKVRPPEEIRPGPHRQNRMTERGRDVLTRLETLFLAEGFVDRTVGDLASRVGCSLRTLYELAPSKDELVLLVVDRVLRRVGREAIEGAGRQRRRIDQLYVYLHTVALGVGHAALPFTRDLQRMPVVPLRVFVGRQNGPTVYRFLQRRSQSPSRSHPQTISKGG